MKVLTALLVAILATAVLFAATFSAASHPAHLLHSLYKEQGRSFAEEIGPNRWNFLNPTLKGGVNGGGGCAGCTLVVGLFEQVLQLNNGDSSVIEGALCTPMKSSIEQGICKDVLKVLLPIIQTYRNEGLSADAACHALNACKTEAGQPTCHLFPTKSARNQRFGEIIADVHGKEFRHRHATLFENAEKVLGASKTNWLCLLLPQLCHDIENIVDHLPAFDNDNDTFSSTQETLRGTYWRGKDLNDSDKTVHPGRASSDATSDDNCNGIFGTDPSGAPYEEKFCNQGEMGIAILGDSASAHFSLPPHWINASYFGYNDYKEILRDAENELDWPMLSWSTGHLNNSQFYPDYWQNVEPTHSLYKYLKKTNLCNNNDYQNLGVNGARVSKLIDFAKILGRVNSPTNGGGVKNKPLMTYMAMIGNDVCNSRCDVASMTTVEEYYQSVLEAVRYTDSVLSPGSVQVLVGLADGRILYEYMHARIHPIGWTNKDVTYTDLYDFLNCLQISPCCGWMNSNATIRNATSAHAAALSDQLFKVQQAVQGTLKNSQVHVITNWIDALKIETQYPKYELIEKSDGFHPSGAGNTLLAMYFFNKSQEMGFWPKPNPYNGQIAEKFPNVMNQVLN